MNVAYTLYKFHFLNGISEINQLFDDILIIWPAPVYKYNRILLVCPLLVHFSFTLYKIPLSRSLKPHFLMYFLKLDQNLWYAFARGGW